MYPAVKPVIIAIGGGSASGKTRLAELISGGKIPVISQDWFYLDAVDGPNNDWDAPASFDLPAMISALKGLKNGVGQWLPEHDYANYKQIPKAKYIDPAPVMIFEGFLALHFKELLEYFDMKLFVDCDLDVALSRRIIRDVYSRNFDVTTIVKRYNTYVKPNYHKYVEPTRLKADLIICNGGDADLENNKGVLMIANYIANC